MSHSTAEGRPNERVACSPSRGCRICRSSSRLAVVSQSGRTTWHGLPTASTFGGRSRMTTLPAPTTVFSRVLTLGADDPAIEPDAVDDHNRQHLFNAQASLLRIERVRGCADVHTGRDLNFIADCSRGTRICISRKSAHRWQNSRRSRNETMA